MVDLFRTFRIFTRQFGVCPLLVIKIKLTDFGQMLNIRQIHVLEDRHSFGCWTTIRIRFLSSYQHSATFNKDKHWLTQRILKFLWISQTNSTMSRSNNYREACQEDDYKLSILKRLK